MPSRLRAACGGSATGLTVVGTCSLISIAMAAAFARAGRGAADLAVRAPIGDETYAAPVTNGPTLGSLDQVSLFCRDVERSTSFYGDTLGLPHLGTYGDLVFFDMRGVRLYLHRKDDGEWRPGSILYFDTDDITGLAASLAAAGVTFTSEPHPVHRDAGTGVETWMAFFEDPDGNTLALSSRVPSAGGA